MAYVFGKAITNQAEALEAIDIVSDDIDHCINGDNLAWDSEGYAAMRDICYHIKDYIKNLPPGN